jgi:hypothetical protein
MSLRIALLVSLLSLLAAPGLQAQVYKVTDKDGNVSFTDRPPENDDSVTVEALTLKQPNSAQPPPARPQQTETEQETPAVEYSTEITSPADQTTIPMGPGNFSVSAAVSPVLRSGERLLLRVDGVAAGEPQRRNSWALTNVFRGEHKLTVERVDAEGKILDSSAAVTVYVMRPGLRR